MRPKAAAKLRSIRTTARRKTRSCGLSRPSQKCPQCHMGTLDYNGLLNLICPLCGHVAFSGSFT